MDYKVILSDFAKLQLYGQRNTQFSGIKRVIENVYEC